MYFNLEMIDKSFKLPFNIKWRRIKPSSDILVVDYLYQPFGISSHYHWSILMISKSGLFFISSKVPSSLHPLIWTNFWPASIFSQNIFGPNLAASLPPIILTLNMNVHKTYLGRKHIKIRNHLHFGETVNSLDLCHRMSNL